METRAICACKTLKGTDCTRYAIKGERYCRQHENNGCSEHPPFKVMIGMAIVAEANRKGSTRYYIKNTSKLTIKLNLTIHT